MQILDVKSNHIFVKFHFHLYLGLRNLMFSFYLGVQKEKGGLGSKKVGEPLQ